MPVSHVERTDAPNLGAAIEGVWGDCVQGLPTPQCPTGDHYVVLETALFQSEEAALDAGMRLFSEYASGKKGTLYWRVRPELAQRHRVYKVYMRLVITDKPVLWPDIVAYETAQQKAVA